jgi:hypothetical protein
LRVLRRFLRVSQTEQNELLVEFADPATGYNGKRARRIPISSEQVRASASNIGLDLRNPSELEWAALLALQGINDLRERWRWLRDASSAWYKHPAPQGSCPAYHLARPNNIPKTFEQWVAPLLTAMYFCGLSHAEIAEKIGISSNIPSHGRSTVFTAIKSLLIRKKISRERVKEAHSRNRDTSATCEIDKHRHSWVLNVGSIPESDQAWLREHAPDLGLVVGLPQTVGKTQLTQEVGHFHMSAAVYT